MAALLALLSSVMWGSGDFLAGTLSRKRAPLAVLGATQVVGWVAMLTVATVTGAWGADPSGYLAWGMAASVCGATALAAFYQALAIGRMGIVSPIAALGVLVPVAAGLFSGEIPTSLQYFGILLAVIGIVLASGPEISGQAGLRSVLLALVAALGFGLFFVFVAQGAQESVVMTMTAQRSTTTVLVLVAFLLTRSLGGLQPKDTGWLLAIGLFDIAANLTFSYATTMGLLAIVSVLGSLYPVVTVLLAWWVHHERLAAAQYSGVAVALVGVAAISAG